MNAGDSESDTHNTPISVDGRTRALAILIASIVTWAYGLVWNLSIMYYYGISAAQGAGEQKFADIDARILQHVLLFPCLMAAYYLATSKLFSKGGLLIATAKQALLLAVFSLLVRPALLVACHVLRVHSLTLHAVRGFSGYLDPRTWIAASLNYSLIYLLGLFLLLAMLFFVKYKESQLRSVTMRSNWLQMQLTALRWHFHPHFIFNTLNTISSFVKSRPDQARDLIAQLANLLRETMTDVEEEFSSLASERDIADRYIAIVRARFGNRVTYSYSATEATDAHQVPKGVLLTLLENAVTHGIAERVGTCDIAVTCRTTPGQLEIEVQNTCADDTRNADDGHQGGLRMLFTRLVALYGSASQLTYAMTGHGNWVTRVCIPLGLPESPGTNLSFS